MHVCWASGYRVIVELDVGVQEVIDRANVVLVFFPALAECRGAKV